MPGAGARALLVDGPWRHRYVTANGIRFHVATGLRTRPDRPLVLLLHGFAEFWWAWRHQIPVLDDEGFAVAALDLRGYGASDKTPRGYDPPTTAADVAGVVRALGYRAAVAVGHDWGSMAAWSAAAYARDQLSALVSVAAPHPLAYPWRRQLGQIIAGQLPGLGERQLTNGRVERLLRSRAAVGSTYLTHDDARPYRDALRDWPSPQRALAAPRAWVRLQLGPAGVAYRRRLRSLDLPVLTILGAADRLVTGADLVTAGPWRPARHQVVTLPGVGHLPHEEAPEQFNEVLLGWLAQRNT